MSTIVMVIGVTGSGKTTVGTMLADAMHCAFLKGDSLRSTSNIEKMSHGSPLTDADGAKIMRRLVLQNQVLLGSVNASRDHFQLAVGDLVLAERRWPRHVADLVTHRHPFADFEAAFQHHGSDEIKVVLEWAV